MKKIIIVGAGLFGSVSAELCRRAGHDVTLVDGSVPDSASQASACLLKPSWLSGLSKEDVTAGYALLENNFGVQQLDFANLGIGGRLMKTVRIDWVDPKSILKKPDVASVVRTVGDGMVLLGDGTKLKGNVLVAAGVHSFDLLVRGGLAADLPRMSSLMGVSLRFRGQLDNPAMHVYAPYKQAVAFNLTKKEIWFGDGTAILQKNFNRGERVASAIARAESIFGLRAANLIKSTVGSRPYVEGSKNGYFEQVLAKTWVSTGGAKNGTLLAALQAQKFLEAL